MIFVILLTLFAVVLESSVISLPLALSILVTFSFIYKKEWLLALSLIIGVVLDALALRTIGASSLFFLVAIFVIFLYEKKIEASIQVVFLSNFVLVFLYTFLIKGNFSVAASFLASSFGIILFIIFNKLKTVSVKEHKLRFEI
ncbi:MAG: hypothetical protein A3B38_02640 [Candidatus Levybacteria bacterium RIFCSPLOWO2_01_FULL_36_13]|nr:MAG: hypothetical protein A2684_03835 [Candidatus Levybacteria bacterium RIFCSPHIGHO2_01_FULL_36_15b]OGH35175.1 MAG: hypothetical protein A3B38_02640 [Candidatus Levybacteria bacterium RIFCSPLOWO2_01_FULL_36_13]